MEEIEYSPGTLINQSLIDFANKYPKIYAIWEGSPLDAEEYEDLGNKEYYFLIGGGYDWDLEDALSELGSNLFDKGLTNRLLSQLPISPEAIAVMPNLERCIYRK